MDFDDNNVSLITADFSTQVSEKTNNIAKKEEFKYESNNSVQHEATEVQKPFECRICGFMSFFQSSFDSHNCIQNETKVLCPNSQCSNIFTNNESLKSHLLVDHKVLQDEIDLFIEKHQQPNVEKPRQKIHIVDYQLLKKPDTNEPAKSKIFIKDVTLLRKPDLPHTNIAIPNIFDSLDLTAEDEILDDFLGNDDQIFNDDFDFDDSANFNSFPSPEPVSEAPEVEIILPEVPTETASDQQSGKIFVRKNLCNDSELLSEATTSSEIPTSKIYVRSHESLTSQVVTTDVTKQPSEASTPDCVIVSSEIISEVPKSKIFIRNIEALTNPQQEATSNQFFTDEVEEETNAPGNFMNVTNNFPPSIFVRRYDSLVNENVPEQTLLQSLQPSPQHCNISIKNMNTLIEPILMQPPLINPPPTSMIFGQAQNLVIHMRPQQADENLINYRDTSMTPDTLPGSSNVSTCGGNDEVIMLDDAEVSDAIFSNFHDTSAIQNEIVKLMETSHVVEPSRELINHSEIVQNPERNETETPNEKTVLQKLEEAATNQGEEQPMVSIPIDFTSETAIEGDTERKKMKLVKIIRIRKKKKNESETNQQSTTNIQVVFKCSLQSCTLHFSSENLLKYHRRCHTDDGTIICPECKSEEFKTFNTLHTHLWRSHKVDMDLYACKLCDFKTPILSRLKNFHEKIHSNVRSYKCDVSNCNKSFKNSKQLKNHLQTHKNKKKEKFMRKVKTSNSIDSSKKIQCGECNRGFSSESGLYIHSMEHKKSDEKKFNCEACDYSTNDHNSFRRHKSQHSMVHHYKCPGCDYTSIQSNTYRKHLEKQHPELAESLLYKCTSCKFTTISKAKFEGHLMKHADNSTNIETKKTCNKIKVKSNLMLTDPMIQLMKDLLPNQANNL
ncbi:CLUMA_CG021221, isoform A [Clunio marinus]|uniref:CLUMA_CG021221, isoform A n=1 Tax=Clunio marinus TaxID=568069 RepID=A0A1J1J9Y3_9DIPT|nr:CLUMA_CG021221, isoform A [Clunio marinus]